MSRQLSSHRVIEHTSDHSAHEIPRELVCCPLAVSTNTPVRSRSRILAYLYQPLLTTPHQRRDIDLRKSTTKGKLKTRVVDIQHGLAQLLAEYQLPLEGALFPGMRGISPTLTRLMADKILCSSCNRCLEVLSISGSHGVTDTKGCRH